MGFTDIPFTFLLIREKLNAFGLIFYLWRFLHTHSYTLFTFCFFSEERVQISQNSDDSNDSDVIFVDNMNTVLTIDDDTTDDVTDENAVDTTGQWIENLLSIPLSDRRMFHLRELTFFFCHVLIRNFFRLIYTALANSNDQQSVPLFENQSPPTVGGGGDPASVPVSPAHVSGALGKSLCVTTVYVL